MATFLERALALVNSALVWLSDSLSVPLLRLPPLVSLLIVSLATAAAMLVVIARTSNQRRMTETKRRIQADLFEIRLLNDDPRAVLRALGEALRHNAAYLALWLVPLLWMALPLAIAVAHLQALYGYTGLEPGTPALLKAGLHADDERGGAWDAELVLDAPAAVQVQTAAVRLPAVNEVVWRIVPAGTGDFTLSIRLGQFAVTKALHVGHRPARRSPRRVSPSVLNQLLYPSEPPLAEAGPFREIAVTYPETSIDVLGVSVHWTIVYLVLSMAWALVLAPRFGITL